MGEGQERDRHQLIEANKYIKKRGLKTCLYSGRDVTIEEWMKVFNYIKIGSFQKDKGPLYSKKTNQRLYKLAGDDDKAEDITYLFW